MNRGRGQRPGDYLGRGRSANPSHCNRRNGIGRSSADEPFIGVPNARGRNSHPGSRVWIPGNFSSGTPQGFEYRPKKSSEDSVSSPDCFKEEETFSSASSSGLKPPEIFVDSSLVSRGDSGLSSAHSGTSSARRDGTRYQQRLIEEEGSLDHVISRIRSSCNVDDSGRQKTSQKPLQYGYSDQNSPAKRPDNTAQNRDSGHFLSSIKVDDSRLQKAYHSPAKHPDKTAQHRDSGHSELLPIIEPFDICLPTKTGTPVRLNRSLLEENREKRNEIKQAARGLIGEIPRPGMVLLKKYLSIADQVQIVKLCRDLGLGPGGFYQPAYSDGARLRLKMMCLGRNWDPDTSAYGERRPQDGATPPIIPLEFHQLVEKAIKDSHALIERDSKASSGADILPWMSPNVCIVNFYSATGRLGLHQDKDESKESLRRGLPVVSFSIGDSGEFLYGDHRDVDKADKIVLESGDVLIFGGKSRHIFHGVSSILPKTAPKALLDKINLRPGRLNLTFREY